MANAVRGHYPVLLVVLPVAFMLAGLLFAVLVDPYIRRKHRQIMLIIIALLATLIAQNVIDYLFELDGTHRLGRTILGIYGYSVRPVILIMFLYIVAEKRRFGLFWALAGVNGLIHLTALFSGICFSINDQSRFSHSHDSPGGKRRFDRSSDTVYAVAPGLDKQVSTGMYIGILVHALKKSIHITRPHRKRGLSKKSLKPF